MVVYRVVELVYSIGRLTDGLGIELVNLVGSVDVFGWMKDLASQGIGAHLSSLSSYVLVKKKERAILRIYLVKFIAATSHDRLSPKR